MKFRTIVADPPWRFDNRQGKVSPEHGRLYRYPSMGLDEICAMGPQILDHAATGCHLYMWVPTALLNEGLKAMASWGFDYKTSLYWLKVTKDGQPDRSCMGFYYRNVVEPCLFGNLDRQRTKFFNVPNLITAPKTGHSIKPISAFELIERQSEGPYLELFARSTRPGWSSWGNQVGSSILITTDLSAVQTWRQVVAEALAGSEGRAALKEIYVRAENSLKASRAKARGQKWKEQIRRTLQRHFYPMGQGVWKTA